VRGESAYLIEAEDHFLAHVEEGLGTKNLVADAVQAESGRCHYRAIGIDTVATIANDLVTCGALPIAVAMHAAVGDSGWFADENRAQELVRGFAEGCRAAGAVWGGGETPALRGMIEPGRSSSPAPPSAGSRRSRSASRATWRTGTRSCSWRPRACRRTG
jgi:phosphoribosylformylglycinamidine cyclo-ligase